MVDGSGVGDVGSVVLRDRHLLSKDGFVVVVVALDADSGEIIEGPDIITRGFVYIREAGDLIDEAALCVVDALEDREPGSSAGNMIKRSLAGFLYEETKRRPMILPVVMEV
jgi:ribonuclease J